MHLYNKIKAKNVFDAIEIYLVSIMGFAVIFWVSDSLLV